MSDDLKKLFSQVDDQPSSGAKEKALAAALSAFDEVQEEKKPVDSQGSAEVVRLTPKANEKRDKTMNTQAEESVLVQRKIPNWMYAGVGSAAVMVMAVYIGLEQQPAGPADLAYQPESEPVLQESVKNDLQMALSNRAAEEKQKSASLDDRIEAQAFAKKEQMVMGMSAPAVTADADMNRAAKRLAPAAPMVMEQALVVEPPSQSYQEQGRDRFQTTKSNAIKRVSQEPVSTFSIDVDTSSYSFVRRQLNQGVLPQKAAVRVEEMVNYFPYDYPLPENRSQPFSTQVSVIDAPWKAGNKLVHIGIQGYELQLEKPRTNLVFLLDVSGSMSSPDKLPLVKQSMNLLLSQLQPEDTVSIAVYAGAAGTVLAPTPAREKEKILAAMRRLQAGGSTAGAEGIKLAYQLAEQNFVEQGVNRIILATDGDFNVGISNHEELKGFVERKRESGVFLSVLGFGQGNYNDHLMQVLAQNGNGVAAYIDSLSEAQKVLVDEATSSLFPIAKDVKIQLEFNPATVSEYRLLGYETRMLAEEDFKNDRVDAGDIGAGHSVTAIYEITPTTAGAGVYSESRYQQQQGVGGKNREYGFLKMRYKLPQESESVEISQPVMIGAQATANARQEAQFATAVAGFAQLLKGGQYTGNWGYPDALKLAQENRGDDPYGYRSELVQLIRKAEIADAM